MGLRRGKTSKNRIFKKKSKNSFFSLLWWLKQFKDVKSTSYLCEVENKESVLQCSFNRLSEKGFFTSMSNDFQCKSQLHSVRVYDCHSRHHIFNYILTENVKKILSDKFTLFSLIWTMNHTQNMCVKREFVIITYKKNCWLGSSTPSFLWNSHTDELTEDWSPLTWVCEAVVATHRCCVPICLLILCP